MCLWHILHDDIPFVQNTDVLQCNGYLNGIPLILYTIRCATNSQSSRSNLTFKISLLLKTASFLKCNYSCFHFFFHEYTFDVDRIIHEINSNRPVHTIMQ